MTFRLPHFWGLRVVSRTGLLLVCGQDRDGPLEMERASSYEVTPSRSGMGPGAADESFAGQLSIPMNPIARSGVFDHRESEAA